jgi:hypothetical protein
LHSMKPFSDVAGQFDLYFPSFSLCFLPKVFASLDGPKRHKLWKAAWCCECHRPVFCWFIILRNSIDNQTVSLDLDLFAFIFRLRLIKTFSCCSKQFHMKILPPDHKRKLIWFHVAFDCSAKGLFNCS